MPSDILYEFEHIHDDRGPELVVCVCICLTLAYIAVALRIVGRRVSRAKLQADDCWIFITLVSKSTTKARQMLSKPAC